MDFTKDNKYLCDVKILVAMTTLCKRLTTLTNW